MAHQLQTKIDQIAKNQANQTTGTCPTPPTHTFLSLITIGDFHHSYGKSPKKRGEQTKACKGLARPGPWSALIILLRDFSKGSEVTKERYLWENSNLSWHWDGHTRKGPANPQLPFTQNTSVLSSLWMKQTRAISTSRPHCITSHGVWLWSLLGWWLALGGGCKAKVSSLNHGLLQNDFAPISKAAK